MSDKSKSSSLERKIEAYPKPYYHKMIVGYVAIHEVSKSEVVCNALKLYFDIMPHDEKQRILTKKEK